jgi:hypothetical protein
VFLHTHTPLLRFSGLRISLFAFLMLLSMTMFGQNYVFETGYDLPSLTSVEQFITTNKHLPNVPSAAEVETEGIDLGEMDKILLQKVEELTLYIIEQQKQLEVLKKELELLKK